MNDGGSAADEPRFGRLERYRADDLTDEQRAVLESLLIALSGKMPRAMVDVSGRVTGGFNYLLIEPAVGMAFQALGDQLTRGLSARLRELTILESARCLGSDYAWTVHAPLARKAGLSDDEIEAVQRQQSVPSFSPEEQAAREVIRALLADRSLGQDAYERAVAALGLSLFYRVVLQAGYYALMSTMLIAFDAPIPGDASVPPLSATDRSRPATVRKRRVHGDEVDEAEEAAVECPAMAIDAEVAEDGVLP
jgi:4-carboxymuconolactone decarboxylase